MKKTGALILVLLLGVISFAQNQSTDSEKQRYLKMVADKSTVIFEGKTIKKNKSFFGSNNKNGIYTSYTIQVEEVLFGKLTVGTIEVLIKGGQAERNGEIFETEFAHGTGLCSGYATFFCKPSAEGNSGQAHLNSGTFSLVSNICYNGNSIIEQDAYNNTYTDKKELYTDLAKFKSITIPKEKKFKCRARKNKK